MNYRDAGHALFFIPFTVNGKESKRQEPDWRFPNDTILVVQVMDCPIKLFQSELESMITLTTAFGRYGAQTIASLRHMATLSFSVSIQLTYWLLPISEGQALWLIGAPRMMSAAPIVAIDNRNPTPATTRTPPFRQGSPARSEPR